MRNGILTRKQIWKRCCKKNFFKKNFNQVISKINKEIQNKKVQFNNNVSVILIPEIKEYKTIQLNKKLWYSFDDFEMFKKEAMNEIYKKKYNSM
jgi:hypothetical protein